MNSLPIGDYGLLSGCRSAALVSRAGSVDWLCFPRFDAPAVFARILDPEGGHFSIRPAGDFSASRAYVDQTMVLETTFEAAAGTAVLTDAMAVGRNERGHDLGADTAEGWRSWSAIHQTYEGPWRDLVHHSGRVLQALTFAPTGAIVAAPTTSLPETVGGERNWDYRYTWVRDASLTMEALWVAACPDEADKFFGFLADAAASQLQRGVDLQIMFGIGGERDLSERELPHLAGWRDSRPVRVGNGAWTQHQLDVYCAMPGAAPRPAQHPGQLDPV